MSDDRPSDGADAADGAVPAAGGLKWNEAHFPGRAPIDAYGNGGFRFAGMSHRGSILCLPEGIHAWHVSKPAEIDAASVALVAQSGGVELLLVGTGADIAAIPAAARDHLRAAGVRVEVMATGAAARTFNVLMGEGRAVAAALLAVD